MNRNPQRLGRDGIREILFVARDPAPAEAGAASAPDGGNGIAAYETGDACLGETRA